jgi:hypothetical protein
MDDTSAQHLSHTAVFVFGSGRPKPLASVTPSLGSQPRSQCHLHLPMADLILAGIQDILAALANPSANSPLLPLIDSHTEALRTISSHLTGLTGKPQPARQERRGAVQAKTTNSNNGPVQTDSTANRAKSCTISEGGAINLAASN